MNSDFPTHFRQSSLSRLILVALAAQLLPLAGQDAADPTDTEAPSASHQLTVDDVEERIADVEGSSLEAPIKTALKASYQKAITSLESAAADSDAAKSFREAVGTAPQQIELLNRQLEELPPADEAAAPPPIEDVDELRADVQSRQAALGKLKQRFAALNDEVNRVRNRPIEIGARLPEARNQLTELSAKLAAPDTAASTPARNAERTVLEAELVALKAEIDMLEQEQLSQTTRENLLLARRDLAKHQLEIDQTALTNREEQLKMARVTEAERLTDQAASLDQRIEATNDAQRELLKEVPSLAAELQRTTKLLADTDNEKGLVATELNKLQNEVRRTREEVKLGGMDGAFVQIMVDLRRQLPNPRLLDYSIKTRAESLRELRLAGFRIDGKIADHREEEQKADADPGSEIESLFGTRKDLLDELRKNYRALVRDLALVDTDQRAYRDLVIEFRTFLTKRLFWQRSSPPVGPEFVKALPAAIAWTFGPERLIGGGRAIAAIPRYHPVGTLIVALSVLALQLTRPRIKTNLLETGKQIRRISNDRYFFTLRALVDTLLLALPVPLLFGFAGWALLRDPKASTWVGGLGHGLIWSSIFMIWALSLRETCRPGGLGIAHFGWDKSPAALLRSALLVLLLVFVPATIITGMTGFESGSVHFDSAGRLAFILAQFCTAAVYAKLFRPSDGILAGVIKSHPDRLVSRTRHIWYALLILAPLALAVLACTGFTFTAMAMSAEFQVTLRLIIIGALFYGMVMRWFMIKERKLALQEAIAARKTRREAALSEEESPDEAIGTEEETLELDLAAIGHQTRSLLRSVTSVAVIALIWWSWTNSLPVGDELQAQQAGGFNLFELLQVVLVITIACTVVRNLPGLLDLAGLRDSGLDGGTRYAVATICQYLATAVAIVIVLRILKLDWSQFGWIAAALSVGLGFGLQEVVANFVCGIILLFERPMRVGDVVTVANVTGTVSKIRMRATTITNWDRQEYVVPNKDFVTGSLINWTLTNSINRIVLPVGVAYGSDTDQARDILLQVAEDHPLIMDDPSPLTSFEAFGDSTLNLLLRCYLPDMDNRLKTITELHAEIDRRFKQAGIEIAFPQQDLHLRSVDPEIHLRPTPAQPKP